MKRFDKIDFRLQKTTFMAAISRQNAILLTLREIVLDTIIALRLFI